MGFRQSAFETSAARWTGTVIVQTLDEGGEHSFDALRVFRMTLTGWPIDVFQIVDEQELIFSLRCGPKRVIQISRKVCIGAANTAFSDIHRDGTARSSHLTDQSILLLARKGSCHLVHRKRETMSVLPNLKVAEVLHRSICSFDVHVWADSRQPPHSFNISGGSVPVYGPHGCTYTSLYNSLGGGTGEASAHSTAWRISSLTSRVSASCSSLEKPR